MIFFHFSKVRRFFSLKEAILDPKCKTKKLNIALNFHYQKSLRLYDVPVRRNSIFRAEGRKFSMSILWRKIWQYRFFYFPRHGPNFSAIFIFSFAINKERPIFNVVESWKVFLTFTHRQNKKYIGKLLRMTYLNMDRYLLYFYLRMFIMFAITGSTGPHCLRSFLKLC